MDFGYLSLNVTHGVTVLELAPQLEERGFESLWLPEHSHLPLRTGRYPGGGDPPALTAEIRDPFVSMAMACAVTSRLRLCTGICLVLQHDLLALASCLATLDEAAPGRIELGVGAGWNDAELANHRPDLAFGQRYSAMAERLDALRAAWGDPESGFSGRWDSFTPSRMAPRPTGGRLPIAVGAVGPIGMRLAASRADTWCPVDLALVGPDGRLDVGGGIRRFGELVVECGRDPGEVPITLFVWAEPTSERIARYRDMGVSRVVLRPSHQRAQSPAATLKHLDELAPLLETFGGRR